MFVQVCRSFDSRLWTRKEQIIRPWDFTYAEKGYIFGVLDGTWPFASYQRSSSYAHHPPSLFNNSTYGYTTLSRTNAGSFDFLGMDLWYVQYPYGGNLNFQGYRGDTLVVSMNLFFAPGRQTVKFRPFGFTNLTEVRWPAYPPVQFDNVKMVSKGTAGPDPGVRIVDTNSLLDLSCSYLRVGTTNSLQRSTDSITWSNIYTFVPRATTIELFDRYYSTNPPYFYRIQQQ